MQRRPAGVPGLDLARDRLAGDHGDRRAARWPSGTATTIPHQGTFRVYLTKPGYDPTKPLGWDDLGAKPIITVTDPPLRDGAYRFSGKLPADRTGRHVLYVVWQTTSTPDTYYSCSDLIVKAAAAAAAAAEARTPKKIDAAGVALAGAGRGRRNRPRPPVR